MKKDKRIFWKSSYNETERLKKITIAVVGPFKLPKHQEYVTPFFTDATLMTIVNPKVIQKNLINFHLF